ncbi:YihY/virulence factor BrkB family protein [Lachnoclostridium sp.]|uniref:YihY/virulence factor BrkB family protein n=1 Tax=Lachnoclostridium sp. TaxID=2028282 RepID=UPI00289ED4CA|nr:YihY/virulence factor BrkB family protein [Lachnoclostridium sp.]
MSLSTLKDKITSSNNRAIKIVVRFMQRFTSHDITGITAKATYYLLLSFFPLSLILLSIFAKSEVNILEYIVPSSIVVLLKDISTLESALTVTSLIILLWSASTSIWALMTGVHTAYTGNRKIKLVQGRIRAISFVFILIIAIFICISLTFLSKIAVDWLYLRFEWLSQTLLGIARAFVMFGFIYLFILFLYILTPGIKVRVCDISFGVILTAIAWIVATWGFEVYMEMFSNYSALYGGIGTFLGLALWLYTVTIIFFCGVEINVMLFEAKQNKDKCLFSFKLVKRKH